MKTVVAILMGLISGFLIYMMVAMLMADVTRASSPAPALVLVTFVGGWILSTMLLLREARSVSAVFRRGSFLAQLSGY